ncbi:MAG: hypothetical protein ACT4PL_06535 [Phycisphaerales bacterium]
MNTFIEKLFDLRTLRPGEEGVRFGFALPLHAYEWVIIILLCAILAWWGYRKVEGAKWARVALGTARWFILALLALLLTGPKLVRPNETVEKDWVLMLVDRSGSMRIEDAPRRDQPGSLSAPTTREAQLAATLVNGWPAIAAAGKDRVTAWMGFDTGAYDLQPNPGFDQSTARSGVLPFILDGPSGTRTDLGAAIDQALAKAAARPISGVVVFSDGRSVSKATREAVRRMQAARIPIVAVPLGSDQPMSDVGVRSVQGPGVAFAMDVVPVEVVLERSGSAGSAADGARVQLVENATGRVLDEQPVTWDAPAESGTSPQSPGQSPAREWPVKRITLTSTPENPGATSWTVRILPGGSDLLAGNNEQSIDIQTVDRPLRVLYLDGYPRWEYRYLQAILTREKSIASTATLLSAGRRYLQEGNTPMPALPTSAEEWATIDTIVIGDMNPEVLSTEQLRQIRERVSAGGAGLLWIAGQGSVPGAWRTTPLGDLLPMSVSGGEKQRDWEQDVTMRPTPLADRLGVMRLLRAPVEGSWWPTEVADPESGWSRLRWAQRIDPSSLKPAAEAMAMAIPANSDAEDSAAGPAEAPGVLVASMRFGAGRVVYVATDEIWRWRFGRGEDLPERFWLQLIRLLGRDSVARAGQRALLSATPARGEVALPVRLSLELIDQSLMQAAPSGVGVRIVRIGDLGMPPAERVTAAGIGEPVSVVLRAGGDGRRAGPETRVTLAGTFIGQDRGVYRAIIDDPVLRDLAGVQAEFELWAGDDELRRPETDHALLAQMASETGGTVLSPDDLSALPEILPRREVHIALASDEEALWDKPIVLITLLLLLTIEWVGRRLLRLA